MKRTRTSWRQPSVWITGFAVLALAAASAFAFFDTGADNQIEGLGNWTVDPVVTVGESIFGYQPTGIFDGTGALRIDRRTVRVLVNSELGPDAGQAYTLLNGTQLTGARVHYFDIDREDRCVRAAGLAFHTVYDRCGDIVTSAAQVNEAGHPTDGFSRFCSAQLLEDGGFGFVDDIFLAPEETSAAFGHPHGGTFWALDVRTGELWALPALGRGTWEGATPIATRDRGTVALLLGDDSSGAPLYLWLGEKIRGGNFIERNGLARGRLFVWKASNGDLSPEDFNGKGSMRDGCFVPIEARDPSKDVGKGNAPVAGHDALGYKDDTTLRAEADALGAFSFSRPEDLHTSPFSGRVAVMASTGRGSLFPSDNWGTIYEIEVDNRRLDQACIPAALTVIYDGDDVGEMDFGIRSPDNLVWAGNGKLYIQEDRSTSPSSAFGATSGEEASIWELNPRNCRKERVAQIDRFATLPGGQTDGAPGDIGNWESSGILDVTHLFQRRRGERRILLGDVQAHAVRDGSIGGSSQLVEGGQLFFLSEWRRDRSGRDCD